MALLSAIVSWSLNNRAIVLIGALLLIVVGVGSARSLPMDAVPDVTNVQVQVITSAPALSPLEVEQLITVPVERAMAGTPHVTTVRSLSRNGLSVVTVVFTDDTDIYFARQLVGERMREAEQAVPEAYGRPEMGPISSGLGEIYQFSVENDDLSLMEREELLDWVIAPTLRTVPGVVEVNSFGGEDKQYQVVVDPGRLQATGLSLADVARALELSNTNAGGGYIEHAREQLVIGMSGMVRDLDDLRSVVVGAASDGTPITIETVAEVRVGPRLRYGAVSKDGKGEAVVATIFMLLGENAQAVSEAVKAKVALIEPSLPAGTRIVPFYDRSTLVDRTIHTVGKNLLEGAALVVIVLFLLLGDLRAGLVVATTIPLAMLFAVSVMNAAKMSGNLMSLGAIDFGLIVDGAVIIVENASRRLSEARRAMGREMSSSERVEVVRSSTLEVRGATVFGEAIIAIVYLPVLALVGTEGKMFRPMAATVLLALLGAFILSLTVVPVLTSYFVKPSAKEHEPWLLRLIHPLYTRALGWVMRRRTITVAVAGLTLIGAGVISTRLGAEFAPDLDEGDLLVEARRLPGIALTESVAIDKRLQTALIGIPEIRHVVSKTGAPELATDPMGVELSDVYVALADRKEWRPGLTRDALIAEVNEALERAVPEVGIGVSQPIQMRTNELVGGIRSDAAAVLYGPDLEQLRVMGDELAKAIAKVPGAVDVRAEQVSGLGDLRVVPDRHKLARHGLTVADVGQLVESLAVGHSVGEVLEGERRFDLVVKTAHGYDGDLDALRSLPLRSSTGRTVPLGDVATLDASRGPVLINREHQSRRIIVEFNTHGRDLVSVVSDARAAVKDIPLAEGYRLEWGGQFEHFIAARDRLIVVVPLALALISLLLWLAFHEVRPALIVFLDVPFAVVGGVALLALRGLPFSIPAGVGFIALFGVAVLNGLVLLTFARQLEREGHGRREAARRAAELRLRPVLMTALVAALGFIPMALSTAPGSEVQRPLATVVIGGLVSATLLTLFVLPVIYGWGAKPEGSRSA